MAAEAEARKNPLPNGALVVREYVRREDVDEERDVLHGADCIKIKIRALGTTIRDTVMAYDSRT